MLFVVGGVRPVVQLFVAVACVGGWVSICVRKVAPWFPTATSFRRFWLLYCGAIVFLMQAGFAIFEAGSLREKNIKNIMLKNILDPATGGLG